VLIVEDDDDLRSIFVDTVRSGGFTTREAPDGLVALQMIEIETPDLVLLDLGLPMLDGLSVHDELLAHAETQHLPILIVTASARDFGTHVRADCVLRKPVTPQQLIETIRRCLRDTGLESRL